MSLIETITTVATTPAQQNAVRITANIQRAYNQLVQIYTNAGNLIWNNPRVDPIDAVNAFGANAEQLFEICSAVAVLIGTVTGTPLLSPVPDEYTYRVNDDGTVTVSLASANSSSSSSGGSSSSSSSS